MLAASLPLLLTALAPDAAALSPRDAQAILQIEAQRLPALALADYVAHDDADTRRRAARALGRLRSSAALAPLGRLLDDPSAPVRAEAAWALGVTPGGARPLLARLPDEPDPAVQAAALRALGGAGDAEAVAPLVAALRQPADGLRSPVHAIAAATALGRMGAREEADVATAEVLSALLDQQARLDGEARLAAAFALARLKPAALDGAERARLLAWARAEGQPATQAYLVRAAGSLAPGDDLTLLLDDLRADPDVGVRVAVARAAAAAGWTGVTALLDDPDPGVRREAMAAVARLEGLDARALLMPIVQKGDELDAAEAARATGDPRLLDAAAALQALASTDHLDKPARFLEPGRPTEIRVAAIDALDAPARLESLAAEDGEPRVRTAAAGALFAHPDATGAAAQRLLDAFDATVAAMAAAHLADHPRKAAEGPLLALLEEADQPDVLEACLRALEALYGGPYPKVRRPDTPVEPFLAPLYGHPSGSVRAAAQSLALALDLEPPPPWHAVVTAPLDALATVTSARIRTSKGEVVVQLFPEEAPVTVHNFVTLAERGYYDNLRIHRVVPDFVVQDGDPRGDGTGGPGWTLPDEPSPLRYIEGTVGMALSGPDTGGSQWFITLSPQPHLDDTYPIFGRVTRGMRVVHALQPIDRIERVRIERVAPPVARAAPAEAAAEAPPDEPAAPLDAAPQTAPGAAE